MLSTSPVGFDLKQTLSISEGELRYNLYGAIQADFF
jgi:hypothetical protein